VDIIGRRVGCGECDDGGLAVLRGCCCSVRRAGGRVLSRTREVQGGLCRGRRGVAAAGPGEVMGGREVGE